MAQRTNLGFCLVLVAALGFSSTGCVSTSLVKQAKGSQQQGGH
jgi:hypothetical protein